MSHTIRIDALSIHERTVLRVLLRRARGEDQAIPVPKVADAAGIHERHARKVVKALVEVHKIPIASSCRPELPGWYICATADEAEANRVALKHRAVSILQRARAFEGRNSAIVAGLQGQVLFDFDGLQAELEGPCSS